MKKWMFISSLFLLSGCSLDPNAAEHYAAEEKLEAEIHVSEGRIQVETSPEAIVSVLFWKEGGRAEKVDLKKEREGVFSAEQPMLEKGTYYVKADIQTDTQHIMPTKKVGIGKQVDVSPEEPAANMKSHH